MSEVFISYGHATIAQAHQIAQALRDLGYGVWRDDDLPPHRDYSEVIEERLQSAKAVLVVWSADAIRSQWVRAEAEVAREAGKLVQVSLDGAAPPLPFNRIQCAELKGWDGDLADPAWRRVVASIGELVGKAAAVRPGADRAARPLADKPSIAVLPFSNLSADPEQEYFVDAVTEDITTALSRWRWFFVIARNSSFAYKDEAVDVRRVGLELGVRYLLEGSVRKVAERVRITAQLVDSAMGAHIWADTFDRELVDLLALQDEITERVVRAIEPAMLRSENLRISRQPLQDYSALDCYQRGMWHLNKVSGDHYQPAVDLFRQAIARDPELALGYIGLSRILYGGATVYGWSKHPEQDLQESYRAAATAISLDPSDADAHFALAGAALYLGRHAEALAAAQQSVALNPNSSYGQMRLAQALIYAGRAAEAIAPIERSLRHSPFDPQYGAMLGTLTLAHFQAKNYAEAVTQAQRALEHGFETAHALLAASLARLGRIDEARAALPQRLVGRAMRESPRLAAYARQEDRDHLLGALALAGAGAAPIASPPPIPASSPPTRSERPERRDGDLPASP